jgi:hypothetical protein
MFNCLENVAARNNAADYTTCKYNIKMDPNEIEWEGVEWIHLAPDRNNWRADANTVKKISCFMKGAKVFACLYEHQYNPILKKEIVSYFAESLIIKSISHNPTSAINS